MDEKTSSAPMQEDPQKGEELSFTITGEDAEAQDALNAKKPEPQQKKKSPLPWILGAAAVISAAALGLILTIKPSQTTPDADQPGDATISEPADTPDDAQPDDQTPGAEDETNGQTGEEDTQTGGNGVSYTVDAEALTDEVLNLEVASCGDDRLTNRDLPYYYWQQYYSFASTYSSYAAYLIDTTKPFDQQMCIFDDTLTWQQYFLQGAVSTYKSVSALWQDARLSGFQLGEEDQDYLDGLSNTVTVSAASYGYESADAYLQTAYGPAATMTGYHDFVERYLTASAYLQALVEAKTYTEADISAYFDENADTYAASSIEKSDVNMVNVRHILISVSDTSDETAMEEARTKADEILAEFDAGDKTAESFGELAKEYTDDSNGDEGGLYENITPGQMVTEFNDWCFDESRQPGDTGIVETSYGVHVMYFDSFGKSYRNTLVENALRTADYNAWHDGVVGDNAFTTNPFGMKFITK